MTAAEQVAAFPPIPDEVCDQIAAWVDEGRVAA